MRCHLCSDGLEHCHEVSIVHADGFAECGGDGPCPLPHHLHEWRLSCAELDPPCPCADADQGAADLGALAHRLPMPLAA